MSATPSPEMPDYMVALKESPFLVTLDRAYRVKCAEANDLDAENTLLRAENVALRAKLTKTRNQLSMARRALELWRIRHKTWVAERKELLR